MVLGGHQSIDPASRYVSPTVVLNPDSDSKIMKEEIFGPILPVLDYQNFDEIVGQINAKEKPLAIYYFGKSYKNFDRLKEETSSGSLNWNEVVI